MKDSSVVALVVGTTVCWMMYMELYKLELFANLYSLDKPYLVFPWAKVQHLSKSSPSWLFLHLTVSMFHVILTGIWVLASQFRSVSHGAKSPFAKTGKSLINYLDTIHLFSHLMFHLVIIPNLSHFGDINPVGSTIINSIPLLFMNYLMLSNVSTNNRWRWWYFFHLTTPIWMETMFWVLGWFGLWV